MTISRGSWATKSRMPTARQFLAAATGLDGRIYALGGFVVDPADPRSEQRSRIVEAYTPSTDTWRTVQEMPTARSNLAAAWGPDGRIYAIGGLTGSTSPGGIESFTSLDVVTCI